MESRMACPRWCPFLLPRTRLYHPNPIPRRSAQALAYHGLPLERQLCCICGLQCWHGILFHLTSYSRGHFEPTCGSVVLGLGVDYGDGLVLRYISEYPDILGEILFVYVWIARRTHYRYIERLCSSVYISEYYNLPPSESLFY